ncbi:MAG: helix-turn-helix transcriptional regulator [Chloroflexia bacterium]|nr:helix-turn-helix transcriptional regulator [Chloroflexia bacterium]
MFYLFRRGKYKINSPYNQVSISSKESVLLKCGTYFSDLIDQTESELYKIIVIHLPKLILKDIYLNDFPPILKSSKAKLPINKIESPELVREFIKGLYFYFDNPSLVSEELLVLKIKELILLLVQTRYADSVNALLQQLFTPQQIDLGEVVNSHLFSDLSVEDLAQLCHMSISTFKRQFKTLFNDTPANYIKLKRLERAKELLAVNNLTISDIAYQTGFSDVAHFSNAFKSAYLLSPTEWRAKT